MRNSFKDPDLQRQFAEQGYVILPLLTTEEAAHYRARAVACMPATPTINDPQDALYFTEFDAERREAGGALAKEMAEERIEALLDDYAVFGGSIAAKVPGSGPLTMHQHQPMTSNQFEPALHLWLTLDEVGEDNGALRVVPGSQQILRHIQSFSELPFFTSFYREMEERFAVTLPMRAGEAILFERSLVHGSAANTSERPSLRVLSTVLPSESTFCVLVDHGSAKFEALELSAAISDPDHYCMTDENMGALKSAGMIDNRNMQITESEFAELIRSGNKTRPGYDPIDDIRRLSAGRLWSNTISRLKNLVNA